MHNDGATGGGDSGAGCCIAPGGDGGSQLLPGAAVRRSRLSAGGGGGSRCPAWWTRWARRRIQPTRLLRRCVSGTCVTQLLAVCYVVCILLCVGEHVLFLGAGNFLDGDVVYFLLSNLPLMLFTLVSYFPGGWPVMLLVLVLVLYCGRRTAAAGQQRGGKGRPGRFTRLRQLVCCARRSGRARKAKSDDTAATTAAAHSQREYTRVIDVAALAAGAGGAGAYRETGDGGDGGRATGLAIRRKPAAAPPSSWQEEDLAVSGLTPALPLLTASSRTLPVARVSDARATPVRWLLRLAALLAVVLFLALSRVGPATTRVRRTVDQTMPLAALQQCVPVRLTRELSARVRARLLGSFTGGSLYGFTHGSSGAEHLPRGGDSSQEQRTETHLLRDYLAGVPARVRHERNVVMILLEGVRADALSAYQEILDFEQLDTVRREKKRKELIAAGMFDTVAALDASDDGGDESDDSPLSKDPLDPRRHFPARLTQRNIGHLARRGWTVRSHYTPMPNTNKAMFSLFCGQYPYVSIHWDELQDDEAMDACAPNVLRSGGVRTGLFTSSSIGFHKRAGFTTAMGIKDYSPEHLSRFSKVNFLGFEDDVMIEPAMRWLDAQLAEMREEQEQEQGQEQQASSSAAKTSSLFLVLQSVITHSDGNYVGPKDFSVPSGVTKDTSNAMRRVLHFRHQLRYLDRFVGKLIREFKQRALWDNTAFVLVSDHGESFGEHGRDLHGGSVYESEVKVPLLLFGGRNSWPGLAGDDDARGQAAGEREDDYSTGQETDDAATGPGTGADRRLVLEGIWQHADVTRTVLDLFGVKPPRTSFSVGLSMLPAMRAHVAAATLAVSSASAATPAPAMDEDGSANDANNAGTITSGTGDESNGGLQRQREEEEDEEDDDDGRRAWGFGHRRVYFSAHFSRDLGVREGPFKIIKDPSLSRPLVFDVASDAGELSWITMAAARKMATSAVASGAVDEWQWPPARFVELSSWLTSAEAWKLRPYAQQLADWQAAVLPAAPAAAGARTSGEGEPGAGAPVGVGGTVAPRLSYAEARALARRQTAPFVALEAGKPGVTCTELCGRFELECREANVPLVNTCDLMGEFFCCRGPNCYADSLDGPDQPCMQVRSKRCLINGREPDWFSCQGMHPFTVRLCPCSARADQVAEERAADFLRAKFAGQFVSRNRDACGRPDVLHPPPLVEVIVPAVPAGGGELVGSD